MSPSLSAAPDCASAELTFWINGQSSSVVVGTSLAAALAAAGMGSSRQSVMGQQRAALCGMGVCHECAVDVDGQRRLACQTLVRHGMQVRTDAADSMVAIAATGVPFNAARQHATAATPYGSIPSAASARPTPLHCDLLIVGAGPAGLAAAAAAAPSGVEIVVIDDNPAPGGQVWRRSHAAPATAVLRERLNKLSAHANVRLLSGARVAAVAAAAGAEGEQSLLLDDGRDGLVIHARRTLLCTGARELFLPFPGWTLPGVTGAGGLQALVKGGLSVRGQRVLVAGSGPLLLATAATLRQAGATLLGVAEQASWRAMAGFMAQLPRWPNKLWQAARLAEPRWRANQWVLRALGTHQLQAVELQAGARRVVIECDRLACGFGLVPNTELGQLLGCALGANGGLAVDAQQATSVAGCFAAGECTGIGGSERAAVQGALAGAAAVVSLDTPNTLTARTKIKSPQTRALRRWQAFADALHTHFRLNPALLRLAQADTLVCRCEDVPMSALQTHDGWVSAKLATRCGMGPCQGRICGAAAQAMLGWTLPPPRHLLNPVRIGLLAGASSEQAAAPKS